MSTLSRDKRSWLTPPEAAKIAEVTSTTIATWCKEFNIGKKINKHWRVDQAKLEKFLEGKNGGSKNGKKR